MQLLLTHPAGNQNVRAVLSATEGAGMLARFATTVVAFPEGTATRLMPGGLRREWMRRAFDIAPSKVLSHPSRELLRMVASKAGWEGMTRHEAGYASPDAVFQDFDRFVADALPALTRDHGLKAVYALRRLGTAHLQGRPFTGTEVPLRPADCLLGNGPKADARRGRAAAAVGGHARRRRDGLASQARSQDRRVGPGRMVVAPSGFVLDSLPQAVTRPRRVWPLWFASVGLCRVVGAARCLAAPARAVRRLHGPAQGAGGPVQRHEAAQGRERRAGRAGLAAGAGRVLSLANTPISPTRRAARMPQVLELMRSCDVFCLPSIVEGARLGDAGGHEPGAAGR